MSTGDECPGRLHGIIATEFGEKLVADLYMKRSAEMLAGLVEGECSDQTMKRLGFVRADGRYRALECPVCGFGPMFNDRCDDLITHHMQRDAAGAVSSNACPRCGTLVHDAALLRPWGGG